MAEFTKMTDEEKRLKEREKAKGLIRATQEMMEDAKEKAIKAHEGDPLRQNEIADEIDIIKNESMEFATKRLQATPNEIKRTQYNDASEHFKKVYEERLRMHGVTKEENESKDLKVKTEVKYGSDKNEDSTILSKAKKLKNLFKSKNDGVDSVDVDDELIVVDQSKRTFKADGYIEKENRKKVEEVNDIKANVEEIKEEKVVSKSEIKKTVNNSHNTIINFDPLSIDQSIQYDIIELPSHGECYPSKVNRLPIRYLTTSDEDLIYSPNMYQDGKLIDVIVRRCVLDKTFDTQSLCKGDLDAILVFLRGSGYGPNYPIYARNPETDKRYEANIDLTKLKPVEFNLKGDENGWFLFTAKNGDKIKFKYLSIKEINEVRNENSLDMNAVRKRDMLTYIQRIKEYYAENEEESLESATMIELLNEMNNFFQERIKSNDDFDEEKYSHNITNMMKKYTMSVNENTDRDFINKYIENMRIADSFEYRTYVNDNTPGVDMNVKINIPESDGGGSFNTFLRFDDYVFANK